MHGLVGGLSWVGVGWAGKQKGGLDRYGDFMSFCVMFPKKPLSWSVEVLHHTHHKLLQETEAE